MLPARWLSYIRENSLSEEKTEPTLFTDMAGVARDCCRGKAEPIDWQSLSRHQLMQLRGAYTYLKELERSLPPGHPARENCQTLRNVLLAIRESLSEIKGQLRAQPRKLAPIEAELEEVRKAFQLLGKGVARLDAALESVHCKPCAAWHAPSLQKCSKCQGSLERYNLARDDRPTEEGMPPEYLRLRQLADHVHRHPDDGQPLREHALQLAELLKATIEPTRKLADAPVEEMVDYLRTARAALLEMADWPSHRDPKRLEKGWLLLRDQLGRFEQSLEDYDC